MAIDTVRYYERIGLLQRPSSVGNRWRRYPEEALVKLRYLREGREVGFSIRELRRLLELSAGGAPRFCETFDAAVNGKIEAIDVLIARLNAQRTRLEGFSRECRQRRDERRCPILERLRAAQYSAKGARKRPQA